MTFIIIHNKNRYVIQKHSLQGPFLYFGHPSYYSIRPVNIAPQLSEKAFVSVITCSATPDYEGGFGHSALRIQDATLNIDVIFNFGSYSDKQSFFAYKILQGTVISYLDGEPFKKFADRYKNDGRGIKNTI